MSLVNKIKLFINGESCRSDLSARGLQKYGQHSACIATRYPVGSSQLSDSCGPLLMFTRREKETPNCDLLAGELSFDTAD